MVLLVLKEALGQRNVIYDVIHLMERETLWEEWEVEHVWQENFNKFVTQ